MLQFSGTSSLFACTLESAADDKGTRMCTACLPNHFIGYVYNRNILRFEEVKTLPWIFGILHFFKLGKLNTHVWAGKTLVAWLSDEIFGEIKTFCARRHLLN